MDFSPLWRFWQTPSTQPLTDQVRRALMDERGLTALAATLLKMVTRRGQYAGRTVSYFRVFDPRAMYALGFAVPTFADLETNRRQQLYAGHVENDGRIVLDPRQGEALPAKASGNFM